MANKLSNSAKAKIISKIEDGVALTKEEVTAIAPATVVAQAAASISAPAPAPTPTPTPTPTIAEDPYYKVDPVTGKSQAQIDAEAAKTAASKGMLGNQNLAPETVEGEGTTKKPLTVDGEKVDGIRNGIEYDNGVAVDATRAEILKAEREAKALEDAKIRAASDPKFNFDVRPAAPPATKDKIFYYSWIGGVNTGEWKLYEAANTEENQVKYLGRSVGGFTNASTEGAAGANTLTVQPVVEQGKIVDIGKGNVQPGGSTATTQFVGPEGFATPMGGGIPMPKPETVTPTPPAPPSPPTPPVPPVTPTPPSPETPTPPVTPAAPTQTYTAPDGKIFTNIDDYNKYLDTLKQQDKTRQGKSAYDFLYDQFNQYGLGALVTPLRDLINEGLSAAEFTLRLRETDAYKKRFAANAQRIAKGLRPLDEATYVGLEDQYQNIMKRYGLPESYYTRGELGRQEGFERFLAGDVSPTELEDRISTAQNRILYANPEVGIALKTFYPDISNGDLLAYALDPEKALAQIKRRITAAEVGASAVQMGLATNVTDAEYLARYGVTKEQAQQGYRNVAEVLPRASMLGDIYAKQGMGPYTQQTAEQEVFNVPGAAEAAAKRRKLAELETAQFSGRAGVGALARERAGGF